MRFSLTLLTLLVIGSILMAQQKVVVTSNGDMLPLKKGQSSFNVAKQHGFIPQEADVVCGTQTTFGYKPSDYPCNQPFVGYHKDTWGQWFISPSSGRIDSFYFWMNDQNDMTDSTVRIRIFKSKIGPNSGPGHGPYAPPRAAWGYFLNTGDEDQGITPYHDFATDPNWVATNNLNSPPDAVPSFDPLGDEIWGLGGFPYVAHADPAVDIVNGIAMEALTGGPESNPEVLPGDSIFITMQQQGTHVSSDNDGGATWCQTSTGVPAIPRNWKFYEHTAGPSQGWQARAEASWIWWIVMSVTGDVPPDFLSFTQLSHTLSTSSRTVNATIQDCNPGNPSQAGIASVNFTYSINSGTPVTTPMTSTGGDNYQATIPGASARSYVSYYMTCTDIRGNVTETPPFKYEIISLKSPYYSLDTNATVPFPDIANNGGTRIANDAWFSTRGANASLTPQDDGTAGPIDMGKWFYIHGDSVRYAWVGVNGGVALTKTNVDSQEINNVGGSFVSNWIFPGLQTLTSAYADIPKNFVALFYNDNVVPPATDDLPEAHGSIYYKSDGTKFIVEYDSVGNLNDIADSLSRVALILDNSDNSISMVYQNVGLGYLADNALIGLQSDTTNKWFLVRKDDNPAALKPRTGQAFKFTVSTPVSVGDGWNMVSVPRTPSDSSKASLFPTATSNAFRYQAGYISTDPLSVGVGYWLKFSGSQMVGISGTQLTEGHFSVNNLWNMIGSISKSVPTSTITSEPTGIVTSSYSGYNSVSGYTVATTIEPGKAYWVKTNNSGILHLMAPAAAPKVEYQDVLSSLNTITIRDHRGSGQMLYFGKATEALENIDRYELPPAPPVGQIDVRFTSQRMVETHPAEFKDVLSYPIQVKSAVYPITIDWSLGKDCDAHYELVYFIGGKEIGKRVMSENNHIRIPQAVDQVIIRARMVESEIPSEFALRQNYPNPFNPSTVIQYELPMNAHVTLTIFNVAGQEVTRLVEGNQSAGYHSVSWDARNLSATQLGTGVYFYRLVATDINDPTETYKQVRKMLLVK